MEAEMNNDLDVKSITKKFFAAYDAHDVEGMLAVCADEAQGRYAPYGRNSLMPIRGGLDGIWRAFPSCRGRLNGRSIALLPQKRVFQQIYAPDLDPFAAES